MRSAEMKPRRATRKEAKNVCLPFLTQTNLSFSSFSFSSIHPSLILQEALERCASNLGIPISQIEIKIASHGQFFSIDPRDWTKLEPTDELHAVKKSKGKQPIRGDGDEEQDGLNLTANSTSGEYTEGGAKDGSREHGGG